MGKKTVRFFMFTLVAFIFLPLNSFSQGEARILSYSGDVGIESPEGDVLVCRKGLLLENGTIIRTGEKAFVTIDPGEGKILNVREKSTVVVKLPGGGGVELVDGEIFTILRGLKPGQSFVIKTPFAVCGARGTGWQMSVDSSSARVAVFEGEVFVTGINSDGSVMEQDFITERGFARVIKKHAPPGEKEKLSEKELEGLDREASFAVNALGVMNVRDRADGHAARDEKRFDAFSSRLEREDPGSRFNRIADPGAMPVVPGRGGEEDEHRRSIRRQ